MIEINYLSKAYGKQTIFNNASYNFPNHGLICLLGASGCGKTTLLNILAGFDGDYQGEIKVGGTSINKLNANEVCSYRRDNIGFVFQNYNLLAGYSVLENIILPCTLHSSDHAFHSKKAKQLLQRLQIAEKEKEKIEHLSGGQKQRVAIARALINDPSIILADEPTGALDRKNSTEIMQLLQEISQDHLVIVITHDQKVCEFADQVIHILDGKIVGEQLQNSNVKVDLKRMPTIKLSTFSLGFKNFRVHLARYLAISFAISIGVLAFVLSLSSSNIIDSSISSFKEKNTAFNNGYIKLEDNLNEILPLLQDERIENVYRQYIINNVTLSLEDRSVNMSEKYPMPKATESMSYGTMPKKGKNEIALNPSLAKKFNQDIKQLIGKELTFQFDGNKYNLNISGIFNAGYDDFFMSSDFERQLYLARNEDVPYSLTYDVKDFKDIVSVTQNIIDKGLEPKTAAKEVAALQGTFENLSRLFLTVSILVFFIGFLISAILLVKLQNSRYREIGLFAALGFHRQHIRSMIIYENMLLSCLSCLFNFILIGISYGISTIVSYNLIFSLPQILLSVVTTGTMIILIALFASYKLLHSEPAVALRK